MFSNRDLLTRHLIGRKLCSQPIKSQIWNALFANMDINMEYFHQLSYNSFIIRSELLAYWIIS